MSLVSLSELKSRLGIASGDTGRDADLTGLIAGAEESVRAYLGWNPEVSAYTEYASPTGSELLTLKLAPPRCPVTVVTVHESRDRVWDADTLLVDGEDYVQERAGGAGLIRLRRNWPTEMRRMPNRLAPLLVPGTGMVRVVYTIANANALAVAKRACLYECMAQASATYDGKGIGVVTQDSMDGASVSVNTNAKSAGRKQNSADGFVSPLVSGLLDPFRMVSVGVV